ncbi:hypothetical protein C8Q77DRAFT_578195 [Trametes polyzona]|nr:hypothetical protein C8Q77DRAFT_578195 [Trametes polyzona]
MNNFPNPSSSIWTTPISQCSALISEVINTLSGPISVGSFARACRALPPRLQAIPVVSIGIYKKTWSTNWLVQTTTGFLGHQYVVATVRLPSGRETHIKADYHPYTASKFVLSFYDDPIAPDGDKPLSRLAAPSAASPLDADVDVPTLGSLASLFAVAQSHVGSRPYRVLGRNCLWMSDALFYTVARRYAPYWLRGAPSPDGLLRRYLRGDAGVLETAVACTLPYPAARLCAWWAAYAVRWAHVRYTAGRSGADRYAMHDQEVVNWIWEWEVMEGREVPVVGFDRALSLRGAGCMV